MNALTSRAPTYAYAYTALSSSDHSVPVTLLDKYEAVLVAIEGPPLWTCTVLSALTLQTTGNKIAYTNSVHAPLPVPHLYVGGGGGRGYKYPLLPFGNIPLGGGGPRDRNRERRHPNNLFLVALSGVADPDLFDSDPDPTFHIECRS